MITEDYVSFEIAKLLKEKGFDSVCHSHYYPCHYPDGSIKYEKDMGAQKGTKTWYNVYSLKNLPKDHYLAPTLQMAMKWLREVHNIIIAIDYDYEFTSDSYCFKIYRLGENGKPERCAVKGEHYDKETNKMVEDIVGYRDYERSCDEYITYEQACEAAIKYCLENLI